MTALDAHEPTLARLLVALTPLRGVEAISLGGSTQAGLADDDSDLDLHVWWLPSLVSADERAIALSPLADVGSLRVAIQSWGLEDHLSIGGTPIELIYFRLDEVQTGVAHAYGEGLDGESFTTALLYSVAQGQPLYDPTGALQEMRERLNGGFPEATFQAVLERRSPLLHVTINQVRRAQRRQDLLSVQQKRATFQGIFFNLLFTLNRCYHPGEKRLLTHSQRCLLCPSQFEERWVASARMAADDPALPNILEELADDLLHLISEEGGIPVRQEVW
ncbi:MAG TPA: DUF4037 domain-containing protein [Ardenticatenaceae bacterium]|jgi:hypothetical protein